MLRRSLCCMLAGIMILIPIWAAMAGPDWYPHRWVVIALIGVFVTGCMWLYDEITAVD